MGDVRVLEVSLIEAYIGGWPVSFKLSKSILKRFFGDGLIVINLISIEFRLFFASCHCKLFLKSNGTRRGGRTQN